LLDFGGKDQIWGLPGQRGYMTAFKADSFFYQT